MIPGTDTTHFWIVTSDQGVGRLQQNILITRILSQPITVTIATIHFKAHIVGTPIPFLLFKQFSLFPGLLLPKIIFSIFIHIPKFAWEKTACPIMGYHHAQETVRIDIARIGKQLVRTFINRIHFHECMFQLYIGKIKIRTDNIPLVQSTGTTDKQKNKKKNFQFHFVHFVL